MQKGKGIAAIILAAGFSSRMGDLKPLLPFGSETAIDRVIRAFHEANIQEIAVVAGYRAQQIAQAVRRWGVKTVYNPRYQEGMYSSIQTGVASLGADVEAFFLLPADYPLVTSATLENMLDACPADRDKIVYPVFDGKRGHPPLISVCYADEIQHGPAPQGLQGLLRKYESCAVEVAVEDEGVLLDMDTPADYKHLLHHCCESCHGMQCANFTIT